MVNNSPARIAERVRIQLAAWGWQHPAWQGSYYPADLPEEWRLGYYSNEFRAVVVPARQWQAASSAQIQEWYDETHEGFHFYLEIVDFMADWATHAIRAQVLGDRLGGFILCPQQWPPQWQALVGGVQKLTLSAPCALLVPLQYRLDDSESAYLQEAGLGVGFNLPADGLEGLGGQGDTAGQADTGLSLLVAAGNMAYSPRQWREIIELTNNDIARRGADHPGVECAGDGCREPRLLIAFAGDSPDIAAMRSIAPLCELMG